MIARAKDQRGRGQRILFTEGLPNNGNNRLKQNDIRLFDKRLGEISGLEHQLEEVGQADAIVIAVVRPGEHEHDESKRSAEREDPEGADQYLAAQQRQHESQHVNVPSQARLARAVARSARPASQRLEHFPRESQPLLTSAHLLRLKSGVFAVIVLPMSRESDGI